MKELHTENEEQDLFERELQKRLASDEWDVRIAKKVFEQKECRRNRSKKRNRIILFSSVAPLSAAAAVLLMLFVQNTRLERNENLHRAISAQIDGTYNAVFTAGKSTQNGTSKKASDMFMRNEVDVMLDDVLDARIDRSLTLVNAPGSN